MIVLNCPKCKRQPKIEECIVNKKYKNGIRRRLCGCPNYCSVLPCKDKLYHSWFEFDGEGDANMIYRKWNEYIELYKENENKQWYERKYMGD